nr:putative methylenetetrahydrofolate reductase [uncultured bacterium]
MNADAKAQVRDFMAGFTIETTPGAAAKIPDYREHLRPGATVAVTFLPGSDYADTVAVARRLRAEGFEPAPHIAARSITGEAALRDFLARLRGEAGVTHAVVLAGAVDKALGPYDSSMAVLESGLPDEFGITTIGVAGHPEGSPDISDEALAAALQFKNDLAERSGADFYLVTQFVFEAAPVIAWERAVRAAGNRLPVHVGIPGLATLKTLISHARACGIGPSMRFLTRQTRNVARLVKVSAPDKLVLDLARHGRADAGCGIVKAHIYPLGGLRRSAEWAYALSDGAFTARGDVLTPDTAVV